MYVYIYIYVCIYIYIIYLTWLYNKGYEPKDITGRVPTCVFSIAHECEINIYDGCLTDHIDSCWKPVSQIHDVLEWKKPIRNTEMTIQSPNDHIVFFWASKLAQSRTFRGVVYHGFYLKDPEISKEYRNQELSAELAFCLSSWRCFAIAICSRRSCRDTLGYLFRVWKNDLPMENYWSVIPSGKHTKSYWKWP